jgi:hypothetical protein
MRTQLMYSDSFANGGFHCQGHLWPGT